LPFAINPNSPSKVDDFEFENFLKQASEIKNQEFKYIAMIPEIKSSSVPDFVLFVQNGNDIALVVVEIKNTKVNRTSHIESLLRTSEYAKQKSNLPVYSVLVQMGNDDLFPYEEYLTAQHKAKYNLQILRANDLKCNERELDLFRTAFTYNTSIDEKIVQITSQNQSMCQDQIMSQML
jgi:hypothetical protein